MAAKDTLWHINWGDGDTTFVIAPDKETALKQMGDGKDMVNTIVCLDAIYSIIKGAGHQAGRREVVEFIHTEFGGYIPGFKGGLTLKNILIDEECGEVGSMVKWQAKLKEWGIEL